MGNNKEIDKPYSGKYIKYRNVQYQLIPEVVARGCQGCALYNSNSCSNEVTSQCLQGFILKKVTA